VLWRGAVAAKKRMLRRQAAAELFLPERQHACRGFLPAAKKELVLQVLLLRRGHSRGSAGEKIAPAHRKGFIPADKMLNVR